MAIVLVLLGHSLPGRDSAGLAGVSVFLVLSGFLITSLLAKEVEDGGVDVRSFFVRRAARLLPVLVLMLAVTVPLLLVVAEGQASGHRVVLTDRGVLIGAGAALLYLGNGLLSTGLLTPFSHTWSLSLEEQFYVLWPFLLPLLARRRRVAVVGLLCVAAASGLLRVVMWEEWTWFAAYGPLTTVGPLLVGAVLALRPITLGSWAGYVGCAILLLGMGSVPMLAGTLGAVFLIAARPSWLADRTLRWVGLRSYSIYLWHVPLIHLPPLSSMPWPVREAMVVGLAALIAAVSWRFLEAPLMARARAWSQQRRTGPAVDGPVFAPPGQCTGAEPRWLSPLPVTEPPRET